MHNNMTEATTPQVRVPLIGEPAPEFTAETTNGIMNFPSDYKGKWVILFSHPADFTPVCTT
jgi:peroxiredoxin (alkyl hydroperoxide reductase subunit C)